MGDAVGERGVVHFLCFGVIFLKKNNIFIFLGNFKIKKMLAIAEEILKLPRDEKIKILQTLQENIAMDDDMAENGNVSAEIMTELKKRAAMVETGEATWIEKRSFSII